VEERKERGEGKVAAAARVAVAGGARWHRTDRQGLDLFAAAMRERNRMGDEANVARVPNREPLRAVLP
jgi:hypothetical protein